MVTTHLVHFFLGGASATADAVDTFAAHLSVPPYYLFSGFSPSDVVVPPVEEPDAQIVTDNLYWASGLRRRGRRDEDEREEYDEEDDVAALLLGS